MFVFRVGAFTLGVNSSVECARKRSVSINTIRPRAHGKHAAIDYLRERTKAFIGGDQAAPHRPDLDSGNLTPPSAPIQVAAPSEIRNSENAEIRASDILMDCSRIQI